jgi:hypothetical protein
MKKSIVTLLTVMMIMVFGVSSAFAAVVKPTLKNFYITINQISLITESGQTVVVADNIGTVDLANGGLTTHLNVPPGRYDKMYISMNKSMTLKHDGGAGLNLPPLTGNITKLNSATDGQTVNDTAEIINLRAQGYANQQTIGLNDNIAGNPSIVTMTMPIQGGVFQVFENGTSNLGLKIDIDNSVFYDNGIGATISLPPAIQAVK